ncbi:DoxX family protein [Geomesophilobacter sediminis]|uniref:DoxX family protein n=1 Tax=Geomesophilobacter sediminis TaxID=2798584 RepID=A0A8J7J0R5_9BACT|nr:DoxX family protein [Geomesophilobacter sediminis]MBJ6724033.1 DoxX family protein [Geomesophilobacter sediminis]
MKRFFMTDDRGSLLLLRVILGVVFFPHGAQKVLGWYGGPGFTAALNMFTNNMHIPTLLAILVILAESLGALGLILGFCCRLCAFGILCDMVGAIILVHWRNGFFMNWMGTQAGEGFEYHLLAIAISLVLVTGARGRGLRIGRSPAG